VDPRRRSSDVDGFVCFSAQDWWYFNRGHSDFQLMTRVARDRTVLLVNSLGMRLPTAANSTDPWRRVLRKVRSAARGCRQPLETTAGFHVYTPVFFPTYGSGVLARLNQRLVLAQVRWVARRLGLHRPAVVVTLPTAWPIAARMERGRLVAYRSDRYSALPEADEEMVAGLERELLRHADVAFFSSSELLAQEQAMTRRPALLSHGIDLDRFRLASEVQPHEWLSPLGHPRVGYVGTIDAYTTDVELMTELARSRPDVCFVLAGPVDTDISALTELDNVRYYGVLPFDDVPRFLAGLDVAIMPWLQNDWIRHCNPVKLKEYLAVGLPVVSTAFPEVDHYADVISVAEDRESFANLLDSVLCGLERSDPAGRRSAASAETWDLQAERMIRLTEDPTVVTAPFGGGV
jgi:glycosyltransferase involved in cell wall biosynthesis